MKSNCGVSQMKNRLYKSININLLNNVPEIIHKYLNSKAIQKLNSLKYLYKLTRKDAFKYNLKYEDIVETYIKKCRRCLSPNRKKSATKLKHSPNELVVVPRLNSSRKAIFVPNNAESTINENIMNYEKSSNSKSGINIKPLEITLGNLECYNKNYDRKIRIYNGKVMKTYILNVERENIFDFCKSERKHFEPSDKSNPIHKSLCNTARLMRSSVPQLSKKIKLFGKDSLRSINFNSSLSKFKLNNDKEDSIKNSKTPIIKKFSTSVSLSNIATTRKEEVTIEKINNFYGIKFPSKKEYNNKKLLSNSNKSLFKNHDFYYN